MLSTSIDILKSFIIRSFERVIELQKTENRIHRREIEELKAQIARQDKVIADFGSKYDRDNAELLQALSDARSLSVGQNRIAEDQSAATTTDEDDEDMDDAARSEVEDMDDAAVGEVEDKDEDETNAEHCEPREPELTGKERKRIRSLLKRHEDDEYLKTIVITTGIPTNQTILQQIGAWKMATAKLNTFHLTDMLWAATRIKVFKTGAIKITYSSKHRAEDALRSCSRVVGQSRKNLVCWTEQLDDSAYEEAVRERARRWAKFKFTRLLPPRFDNERKKLSTAAIELKSKRKIDWFQFFVVKGSLIMKTWSTKKQGEYRGGMYWVLGEDERMEKSKHGKGRKMIWPLRLREE